jgi:hypothetical protein
VRTVPKQLLHLGLVTHCPSSFLSPWIVHPIHSGPQKEHPNSTTFNSESSLVDADGPDRSDL